MITVKEEEISIKKIKAILKSGDFSQFLGYAENTFFEAKMGNPWSFESVNLSERTYAKTEAAKDIGCIANKNEGFIVLGLATPTSKDKTSNRDYVVGVSLIKKSDLFDKEFIEKQLRGFIYPQPIFKVFWCPSNDNPTEGLGVIHILPENDRHRFYITTVNMDEKGNIRHHFGVPVRDGDQPSWLKEKMVYDLIRQRPSDWQASHARIMDELGKINEKIDDFGIPVVPNDPEEDLAIKMEEIANEQQ